VLAQSNQQEKRMATSFMSRFTNILGGVQSRYEAMRQERDAALEEALALADERDAYATQFDDERRAHADTAVDRDEMMRERDEARASLAESVRIANEAIAARDAAQEKARKAKAEASTMVNKLEEVINAMFEDESEPEPSTEDA